MKRCAHQAGLLFRGAIQERAVLESIIGNLGLGRSPERVLEEFVKAKLPGEGAVREQIKLIRRLTSKRGRYLTDLLLENVPLVVLLESGDLSLDQILALEVAMMAVLSGKLRSGDRRPWN